MKMIKNKTHKKGITFIELMIVLVILSTMVVLSAPKMKGFHQNNELNSAARSIASLCRFARAQAVLTETKVEIRFDVEEDKYWLVLTPEDSLDNQVSSWQNKNELKNPLEEVKELPKFVIFEEIASDAEDFKVKNNIVRVIYYPNGSATNAYIVLKNSRDKMLTIEIPRATGYPEVYKGLPTDVQDRINEIQYSNEE